MSQPFGLLAPPFSGGAEYTVFSGSTTANEFGAWTQIGTSPAWPCNRLRLVGRTYSSGTALPGLINVGIGPLSSPTIILQNMLFNSVGSYASQQIDLFFRTFLPPNSIVSAQMAQNATTSYNFELGGLCWNDGSEKQNIITSYVDTSISSGIQVAISASGSWGPVTITSSSGRFNKYAFSLLPVGSTNYLSISSEILLNGNSISPALVTLLGNGSASLMETPAMWGEFECDIPEGSTITMQGYASVGGALSFQIAFYGILEY